MNPSLNNTINIVLSTDEKYICRIGVLLYSLLVNNKKECFNIYILINTTDYKKNKDYTKVNVLLKEYNCYYQWIYIDNTLFTDFVVTGHVSAATYTRLFIPELILENSINKLLYLDGDIIINDSIGELWNVNLGDNYLGAVSEGAGLSHYGPIKMGESVNYFNAGVLLINLKRWRNEKLTQQFIKRYYEIKEHILYWDQDVLNSFFNGAFVELDLRFNYLVGGPNKNVKNNKPVILHFAGSNKPWMVHGNKLPFYKIYEKYTYFSPWKRSVIDNAVLFILRTMFGRLLLGVIEKAKRLFNAIIRNTVNGN